MKAVLIDNSDNTFSFLKNDNIEIISFPRPSFGTGEEEFDIDIFIVERFIEPILSQMKFDVLIIPYSVTDNFIEFVGLRIACHVRLSNLFGDIKNCPIIFIGNESPWIISRLTPLSNILNIEGSYWCRLEPEKLKELTDKDANEFLGLRDRNTFLNRLKIEPPANYNSHHNVANEFALLRWSEYLKCDTKIPEVKRNLKAKLYFNYLKSLNPVVPHPSSVPYLIKGRAKVLLIDDEADKGWAKFYEHFFNFSPNIKFHSFSFDFKFHSREEIISEAMKFVEGNFNPDIVLLDLRLNDEDFKRDQKPEDLTGYQILQKIKGFNKGIQVIITTASNKVWNYESTLEIGANGYIIKGIYSNVEEDIKNLRLIIEKGIIKATILKDIANRFSNIIDVANKSIESEEFKKSIISNLEISYKLLEESFITPKYINYSYLQLFLIAEEFLKQNFVFEEGHNCYVIDKDQRFLVLKLKIGKEDEFESAIHFVGGHYSIGQSNFTKKYLNSNFKMSAVLLFKYGCSTSGAKDWTKIYKTRNEKAAHPEIGLVDLDEYRMLVSFLEYILDFNNCNPTDISHALTMPTLEEQRDMLKAHWGAK